MTIPVVSSITFDNCTTAGTAFATVTYFIQGSNFAGVTGVTIGGNSVTSFFGDGSTWLRVVTMPAHAAGAVDVAVTNPSGTGTGTGIFTYVAGPAIGGLSPPSGIAPGGGIVGIAGSGFTGATAVTFGGVAATIKAVPNDYSIIVIAPAHAAGAVDVTVTAPSGTATRTAAFTYTAPASPARNVYLWDDCCHNWFSSDTGGTFREGATPGGPSTPAPDDPGQDPHGVGTLLDEWSDGQMAINDGDYLTLCGFDFDYSGAFGIIAVSPKAGQNLTYTLIDPEPGQPAFIPDYTAWQTSLGGAISSGAQTILCATNSWNTSGTYPRISRDGGNTWGNVSGVPTDLPWARAAFSAGATTMYLLPDNDQFGFPVRYIYKSADSGVTWNQLSAGPQYNNIQTDETKIRIRCSANGQTVVTMAYDGNFWISKNGGTSWTNTNFATVLSVTHGRYADCSVTPDGSVVVVSFEQIISSGYWPAVFISTDGGTSFTNITSHLKYPALVGPPVGTDPGYIPTGCTQCNVSPDGQCVVVTFIYSDFRHTDPDGITGASFLMYANVSTDAGATFTLVAYDADPYESGSFLGLFTGIFATPYTFIPPPGPTPPPFVTPRGGYIIERLDNRIWPTVENVWAVDCGFTLAQPTPDADLQIIPVP